MKFARLLLVIGFFTITAISNAAVITSVGSGTWVATAWPNTSRTGTITTSTASTTINGVGTLFLTEISVGSIIKTTANVTIGTVASITNNTTLVLTAVAASNNAGIAFNFQGVGPGDDAIIATGHIVTLTTNQTCNSLTINGNGSLNLTTDTRTLTITNGLTLNGTSSLQGNSAANRIVSVGTTFSVPASQTPTIQNISLSVTGLTTVAGTLTLNTGNTAAKTFTGGLTISGGGTFTNTSQNVPITIGGNLVNNGTFNQGIGRVTFTGAASNSISGAATTTAFGGGITVNKGASQANILDVLSVITMSNGGLTITNGTFRLSSNSTIVPFTANPGYGANARLWCNGGVMNMNTASFDLAYSGTLQVSAGTLNLGAAADDNLTPNNGSSLIISGGALNLAGRLTDLGANDFTTTISGGVFTACTVGSTTFSPITLTRTTHTFNMSGGTIVIQRTSAGSTGYQNLAATASSFTGGTLQIGNSSTPAASSFGINTTLPIYNLTVNSANANALVNAQAITVTNNVTISAGTLTASTFGISVGGNWTNNGTFTPGTTTVTLNGAGTQTVGGSSATSFNNLTLNNSSGSIPAIIFGSAITTTNTLTMTQGVVNQAGNQFTLGASGAASTLTRTAGWFYGGTFRRFWPNTTTITAANYGLYPVGAGKSSSYRPVTVASTGNTTATGSYSVTHTDIDGAITLPAPVTDNAISLQRKQNAQFVGLNAGVAGGGTYTVSVTMTGLLASPATLTDIRLGANNGTFSLTALGTAYVATAGSVASPTVSRSGLSLANLNNDFRVVSQNATNTPLDANTYYWNGATTNWQTTTNWTPTRTTPASTDILFFETTAASNRAITNVPSESEGKITVTGSTNYSFQSTISAKTLTLNSTSVTNCLQIDNGSTLTVGDVTIPINLTMPTGGFAEIGGQLNLSNGNLAAGGATLTLHTNSAPLARTSGQVSMNASSVLNFGSPSRLTGSAIVLPNSIFVSAPTISSLTVNRTNGATLGDQQITVNSGITLTLGDLNTNGAGRIRFGTAATDPVETTASKIVGFAETIARTVGTGALDFLGFSIASGSDNIGNVSLVRRTGTSGINTFNANQSIASTWDVTTTDPASGRNLVLRWVPSFDNVTTATNQFQIYRFSSGPGWTAVGSLVGLSSTSPLRQTAIASTTILNDTFTLTDATQILPIELLYFEAKQLQENVRLTWKTVTEINNDFFTIERMSQSDEKFAELSTIKGAGTKSTESSYEWIDRNPLLGTSYYRLKQTDFDGRFSYSDVRVIENNSPDSRFSIYPNPIAGNKFTLELNGLPENVEVPLSIVNMQGIVMQQSSYHSNAEGRLQAIVELAPVVPSGIYMVVINAATGLRKKIVIP